jgi:hypothetical protein
VPEPTTPTPEPGPFLNAGQVGSRMGWSADTVRRMWDAGTLPWVRINGRRRTPVPALEQWVADLAAEATAGMSSKEA